MHRVVILALPGVLLFDLATPMEVFGRVRLADGRAGYRVDVCGTAAQVEAGGVALLPAHGLEHLHRADTVIVPGVADPAAPVPDAVLAALRAAAAAGTRIASVCVGAFTLAAAGLLDGRPATTHWLAAEEFRRRFPTVRLDPAVLYVDDGQVLTSAGAAAGIDLCLHMVRSDHGAAVAADAARAAVVPLQREGGQAQFVLGRPAGESRTELADLLVWVEERAHLDLTLDDIAARAAVSIRTLNRRFHDQVGTTPMQWLSRTRVRLAQEMLETTSHPVERVAREAGFTSTAYFRVQFRRVTGVAPNVYRRTFRAPEAPIGPLS